MDVCRTCLSSSPEKDLCHLNSANEDNVKNYKEILCFCLDIQVTEDSRITRKLCLKCCENILSFYKFKSLALKNDAYLKNVANCVVKLVQLVSEQDENASNPLEDCNEIDCDSSIVKEEPEIKEEKIKIEVPAYQSDEEPLSVYKEIKYDNVTNGNVTNDNVINGNITNGETKEIAPVKKKRGRPKSIKTDIKKFEVCQECGKSVRDLKEHVRSHIPLKDRQRIKCKECDKTFATYSSRWKHYHITHLGIKQHCDICNKDVTHLKRHTLIAHNSEQLPYECVLCARRFISPAVLETHMLVHTKDKPYECDICHKKFRMQVLLSRHKRAVHDKEKSNLCQYCSKSFFKKCHLEIHMRSHTKEKPYKCPVCGKGFRSSENLNNHKLTHSEQRTFQCEHCDSAFIRPDYLRRHQLRHSKEKKHPCRYCGVKFGRTDHRNRHEFTAHQKHLTAA